jgi:FMN phosphatase YigB (HAD superfamily)
MQFDLTQFRGAADGADVVSFDVFDTLFVRPLCDPEDLFDIIGERTGIKSFRERRRVAQTKAFQAMHARGEKEITLEGIYACFDDLPMPSADVAKLELALELELTRPNPDLRDFFVGLVGRKRVVITSDMYLPVEFFDSLLKKYGLPEVPLFISAHRNATKRDSGELFDIVAAECGVNHGQILHIGDNELSDIRRAREKGLKALHYVDPRRAALPAATTPSASVAWAIGRACAETPAPDSFEALGFNVGGPAALAFLRWINRAASRDNIDLILFTSRDGYVLERMEKRGDGGLFPRCEYFKSSRVALTLAGTNENNFERMLPFLLSGADELCPFELLERIGVAPPADHVMSDIGLGFDVRLGPSNVELFKSFLWACRWDILKVCRQTRAGLFTYLRELGVKPGMRVAMVDVGWNGTTQEALHQALKGLLDIDLYGYYLCLTEQPECMRRKALYRMDSLLSRESVGARTLERVYANRVAVELFFSAPHHAVIGYAFDASGVMRIVEDRGRGQTEGLSDISASVLKGIEQYGAYASELLRRIELDVAPEEFIEPLLRFVENPPPAARRLLDTVTNFDAWASSRNRSMRAGEYLV